MSIFFKGKEVEAVLFSPLEGKITYQGKPAAGAKIMRWVAWKDTDGETDVFYADNQGKFNIPKKTIIYKENPLVQISIGQELTVEYQGKRTLIWKAGKSSSHLFGELGGQPVGLTCELTKEEMTAHLEHALVETLCEWENLKSYKE
ncbi:MAG: DUF6795 domain-containing protein [Pseudomonadota bacterium]